MASEGGDPASPHEATQPPSQRVDELEAELADLEDRVDELAEENAELEAELEERTNALAKVQADYENYRKRVDQEKQEAKRGARTEIVEVLAGVLDDVDRALDSDADETVRKGLELLTKRVEDKLTSIDAERLEPEEGQPFDPERHEVLVTETTQAHEPDTVVELLQPGYALDDRIVREARVKVAQPPDED
jgi:molecular chaperone GrpE